MNTEDRAQVEKAAERQALRVLRSMWYLDEMVLKAPEGTMQITEIRIRMPFVANGQFMVVCKGVSDGHMFVGFHSANVAVEAVAGALERIEGNQLKWREDQPYEPPAAK